MGIFITAYNTICNLGYGMEEIYQNACRGDISKFTQTSDIIKNTKIRIGKVSHTLPETGLQHKMQQISSCMF